MNSLFIVAVFSFVTVGLNTYVPNVDVQLIIYSLMLVITARYLSKNE